MSTKKIIISVLKVILPIVLGGYLMWRFYTEMDNHTKEVFYKAIKSADYFWIILSMVLGFTSHLLRAHRWKYTLEPLGYKTRLWHRYHALMVGYLINLLIPRAGEVSRGALLYQTDKVPFSKSFGTIIAERMFDLVILLIIFCIALLLNFSDLISVKDLIITNSESNEDATNKYWMLYLFAFIVLSGITLFAVLWFKSDKFKTRVITFVKELLRGVFAIFKSKNPFLFTFQTLLIWLLYIVFFGICFLAFEETKNFPINGILIGFIAGTLGQSLINGGIGAYPYLVGIVVIFYIGDQFTSNQDAEGLGKALGMIIWLSQTVLMIVLGLISLVLIPKNYKKEDRKNGKVESN